jgi:hypothetical protein
MGKAHVSRGPRGHTEGRTFLKTVGKPGLQTYPMGAKDVRLSQFRMAEN